MNRPMELLEVALLHQAIAKAALSGHAVLSSGKAF